MKTFLSVNFGCRVNSAETNQLSQDLVNQGYIPDPKNPDIILINTCAITKKGEYESISRIKDLAEKFPNAQIIATGCADLTKVEMLKNIKIINKNNLLPSYTHQIKDKFSHTNRYLLKIQSGCTANCSYCIVPNRRPNLWSLPIDAAISIVDKTVTDGYEEIISTGVNLNQYTPGFSNLVESLLTKTKIKLISFGSLPLLCIDDKFILLLSKYPNRISNFLHIPLQSGSDKILKLMGRPYDVEKINKIFYKLKQVFPPIRQGEVAEGRRGLNFGTDIIVGFPTETESEFQDTLNLCQQIGFSKIHTFKFSPRPGTTARELFLKSEKISKEILKSRSTRLRQLSSLTLKSDE